MVAFGMLCQRSGGEASRPSLVNVLGTALPLLNAGQTICIRGDEAVRLDLTHAGLLTGSASVAIPANNHKKTDFCMINASYLKITSQGQFGQSASLIVNVHAKNVICEIVIAFCTDSC